MSILTTLPSGESTFVKTPSGIVRANNKEVLSNVAFYLPCTGPYKPNNVIVDALYPYPMYVAGELGLFSAILPIGDYCLKGFMSDALILQQQMSAQIVDFTIEAYVHRLEDTFYYFSLLLGISGGETSVFMQYNHSGGFNIANFRVDMNRGGYLTQNVSATQLLNPGWTHFAITCKGRLCTLWWNGVSLGTMALPVDATFYGPIHKFSLGGVNLLIGGIRIVWGRALYTIPFTPDMKPFGGWVA